MILHLSKWKRCESLYKHRCVKGQIRLFCPAQPAGFSSANLDDDKFQALCLHHKITSKSCPKMYIKLNYINTIWHIICNLHSQFIYCAIGHPSILWTKRLPVPLDTGSHGKDVSVFFEGQAHKTYTTTRQTHGPTRIMLGWVELMLFNLVKNGFPSWMMIIPHLLDNFPEV